jgi:DNA-binding CsgD family transcriptional regulator
MTRYDSTTNRRHKLPASRQAKSVANDNSEMRKSGIRVIGDIRWGEHICVFYQTKQDLLDTLLSYIGAGLESNEFCVWAVSDPINEKEAESALRRGIPGFDRHLADERIEILRGTEWYLKGDQFDLKRITKGWREKLDRALANGFEGMRVSGNAFWMRTHHWKEFCEYEQELDRSLAGQKMIVLCTYSLRASRATDVLDVARAHKITVTRRNGNWEFLETPELKQAKREIKRLNGALDVLLKPFPGQELLTPRERMTLAQMLRGASYKEAARSLGISPRTVEFHRANIMRKLGAKNTIELVHRVLGALESVASADS